MLKHEKNLFRIVFNVQGTNFRDLGMNIKKMNQQDNCTLPSNIAGVLEQKHGQCAMSVIISICYEYYNDNDRKKRG